MKRLVSLLYLLLLFSGIASANTPGKHTVGLGWTAPLVGCSGGCTYNVYRATTAGACSGTPTAYATGVTLLTYTDTGVSLGQTYYYDVSAVGTGGEGTCSGEVQIAVPSVPGAPTSLQGTVN